MYSNFKLLYKVYELNNCLCNTRNEYTTKKCFFGTDKLTRNLFKSKFTYNGQVAAFDGAGSCCFGNQFARKTVIFRIGNSSSSHTDNIKNNYSVLGEGPIDGINGKAGTGEVKCSINSTKATPKSSLNLY